MRDRLLWLVCLHYYFIILAIRNNLSADKTDSLYFTDFMHLTNEESAIGEESKSRSNKRIVCIEWVARASLLAKK